MSCVRRACRAAPLIRRLGRRFRSFRAEQFVQAAHRAWPNVSDVLKTQSFIGFELFHCVPGFLPIDPVGAARTEIVAQVDQGLLYSLTEGPRGRVNRARSSKHASSSESPAKRGEVRS